MIRNFILSGLIAATALTPQRLAASDQAEELLDKVVEWTTAKGTLEVDYTLTAGDAGSQGTIVIDGKRFRVLSDMLDTWFDGTNQWSYSPQTGEVNLTVPTDEELQQINPFVIIDAFRRHYTSSLRPMNRESTHHVVLMVPRDTDTDIERVEVSVPVGYFYPARIVVWTSAGETLAIDTRRIIRGNRTTDADFTYDPARHPEATVIDLR